jgi:hypothetical protein
MKSAKKSTGVKPLKLPNKKKNEEDVSDRRDSLLHHTTISRLGF